MRGWLASLMSLAYFAARARIHEGADLDEIRTNALTPMVRESRIRTDTRPQPLSSYSYSGVSRYAYSYSNSAR